MTLKTTGTVFVLISLRVHGHSVVYRHTAYIQITSIVRHLNTYAYSLLKESYLVLPFFIPVSYLYDLLCHFSELQSARRTQALSCAGQKENLMKMGFYHPHFDVSSLGGDRPRHKVLLSF